MIQAYAAHKPKGRLEPFEYDPGQLASDEVEIDVQYCGICHSDLSMINNEWNFSEYPLVPGHEVIGTVAAVGNEVDHVTTGDAVGLGWHAGYCMTCPTCLDGDHNLCASAQATIAAHHGGFADKVRARGVSVIKLPDAIDAESAGPLLCGGITVFNPLVQFDIKPTDSVAVIGIGGLGHMALQFARKWGCEVTAFTSTPAKMQEALELGAHYTLNSRDPAAIKDAQGTFDLIISTVNVNLDWNAYLETLRPKGRFHNVGAVLEPFDIQIMPVIMKQISISGSPVGSPATIAKMLEFAVRHEVKPVIETFAMSQVNEAMEHLNSGKAHYRIVLRNT
jgi:uncharacterized zinc-type alcohol dehydrogenase-like protein